MSKPPQIVNNAPHTILVHPRHMLTVGFFPPKSGRKVAASALEMWRSMWKR